MKLSKQLFCFLLSLILVVSVVPSAFAQEEYSIEVEKASVQMDKGGREFVTFSANIPNNDSLSIKSNNTNVATCKREQNTLVITANKVGVATITIKAIKSGVEDSAVAPATISVSVLGEYTVSFDAQGGDKAPDKQTVKYGEKCSIPNVTPERKGFIFKGWASSDNKDTVYQSGVACDLTDVFIKNKNQDITLVAVWETIYYSVEYNKNTTGEVANMPGNLTGLVYSTKVKISENVPVLGGYKFLGWSTKKDGEAEYKGAEEISITESISLYALWEKNEVKFSKPSLTIKKSKTATATLNVTIRGTCSYYRISAVSGVTYSWGTRVGNTIPLTVDVTGVGAKKYKVVKTIRIRTYDMNKTLIANSAFKVTIYNMKKPVVTLKNGKDGTKTLKWKKVTGAQSYKLLCSSNKKFTSPKEIKVEKGRKITLKKNTSGKVYYKVCAVRDGYLGQYSKVKFF